MQKADKLKKVEVGICSIVPYPQDTTFGFPNKGTRRVIETYWG